MPTAWEKFRALDKLRLTSVLLAGAVAVYAFATGMRAGIGGDATSLLFGIFLAGMLFGGAMLLALGPTRYGAGIIGVALVAWIAWIVVSAPETIDSTWPWWGALAVAAGIGVRDPR